MQRDTRIVTDPCINPVIRIPFYHHDLIAVDETHPETPISGALPLRTLLLSDRYTPAIQNTFYTVCPLADVRALSEMLSWAQVVLGGCWPKPKAVSTG